MILGLRLIISLLSAFSFSIQSPSIDSEAKQGANALSIRLKILRYVFGTSEDVCISSQHLDVLWQLCSAPKDREELMVFIDSASGMSSARNPHSSVQMNQQMGPLPQGAVAEDRLSPAITDEVCVHAFLSLFCDADFKLLGEEAYQSFQSLSSKIRSSVADEGRATRATLDALWKICLVVRNKAVASRAMKDLLEIYSSVAVDSPEQNSMPVAHQLR